MPHPRLRLTRLSLSSRRMIFIFGVSRSSEDNFMALQIGYAHRTEFGRTSPCCRWRKCCCCSPRASCAASTLLAAFRGRRLRAPRHCCTLTALPPPPKCSGNEEGAKMTGSISDFASRTCASTTVPRELAFGACSRGSVCAWATTTSSTPRDARRRKTRKC